MINSFILSGMGALFSAVLTFMAAAYWFTRNRDTAAAKMISDRLAALESKAMIAEQAIMPISNAFQAILVKQLTHYHTPILDALLAKLDPYILTDDEEALLLYELEKRTRDMGAEIDASERNAAKMLPFVMKRIKEESDLASKVALQIVVVPMKAEEIVDAASATATAAATAAATATAVAALAAAAPAAPVDPVDPTVTKTPGGDVG